MQTRYALPLTFLFSYDQEAKAWASIACEISVASCGDSIDEARAMLEDALDIYLSSVVELDQLAEVADPKSPEDLAELLSVPPEQRAIEYHTALLSVEAEPRRHLASLEFLPTVVKPIGCQLPVAA